MQCCGQKVKILDTDEAEKYLGRKLSTDSYHGTELNNRLASGWAAFFKFKATLCNRVLPLRDRIRLFEATVLPCVTYACGTWTLTMDMEAKLRTTRRRMLRWMIRTARSSEESWPGYITRATAKSEKLAEQHGSKDWVQVYRQCKCQLARKAATRTDGRWSHKLLTWKPWFRASPHRSAGHPVKRWEDDFVKLAGDCWSDAAMPAEFWEALSLSYMGRIGA